MSLFDSDFFFPGPMEGWLPMLVEVMKWREDGLPGTENIGLEHVDFSFARDQFFYTRFTGTLVPRFLTRYAYRMINGETLTRWQNELQKVMDEIGYKFEYLYLEYQENVSDIEDFFEGSLDTETLTLGGTDSISDMRRRLDTPDASVNSEQYDSYANAVDRSDGTTTYGRTETATRARTMKGAELRDRLKIETDGTFGIQAIDNAFLDAFERCFLNVLYY